jgi:transcription initiation factor IIE alpha subunit
MTRTYALTKLLEHGELTRKELREITGWTEKQLRSAINYLTETGKIVNAGRKWRLIEFN